VAARTVNRSERILIYMAAGIVGISVLDIIGLLVAAALGAPNTSAFFALLPAAGLPIAMLLLLAATILMAVRRRRESAG
jgi:hypothetical protein